VLSGVRQAAILPSHCGRMVYVMSDTPLLLALGYFSARLLPALALTGRNLVADGVVHSRLDCLRCPAIAAVEQLLDRGERTGSGRGKPQAAQRSQTNGP
jgi:hypothetical protein